MNKMNHTETEIRILNLLGTGEQTNIELAALLCESQLNLTFYDFTENIGFWAFDLYGKQDFVALEKIDISIYDYEIDYIMRIHNLKEPHEALEYMNLVEDISLLAYLKNLQRVYFLRHKVIDISSLAHLNKLIDLNLASNRIEDISPLARLDKLVELNLASNRIEDISPLFGLKNLEIVCLLDNPFPKEQAEMLQKYLLDCIVEY
jgi:Leucine-rich repeat (LRR) protein